MRKCALLSGHVINTSKKLCCKLQEKWCRVAHAKQQNTAVANCCNSCSGHVRGWAIYVESIVRRCRDTAYHVQAITYSTRNSHNHRSTFAVMQIQLLRAGCHLLKSFLPAEVLCKRENGTEFEER